MADKSKSDKPSIIIKKKVGGHGHGHHGGAWKVAYADFVTAMMAFFLLLWLLNVTTAEQKNGIADYFTPDAVSKSISGGGDILSGSSMTQSTQVVDPSLPPVVSQPVNQDSVQQNKPMEKNPDQEVQAPTDAQLDAYQQKKEEEAFKDASDAIKQAMQESPDLTQLINNIIVEQTPEGLRIQIIDQDRLSMFPIGSAEMYDYTKKLLAKITQVVTKLPNKIKISGHTDSAPYPPTASYTNWELSIDRANSARRVMVQAGLPPARLAWVVGSADTEHIFPDDPTSPRNRRLSIVLLKEDAYKKQLATPTAPAAVKTN